MYLSILFYGTCLILIFLYYRIDKKMMLFWVFIMLANLSVKFGLIGGGQPYVIYLMAVQLTIFTMLLYLSGLTLWRIILLEIVFMSIAFWVNAPDLFKGVFSRAEIIDIMQEFEKEIFIASLLILVHAKSGFFKRFLITGHVISYGISVIPPINYAGIITQNWLFQSILALSYNLWWIASAIIYQNSFRSRRFYAKT